MQRLVVYGVHTVSALLSRQPERVLQLWCDKARRDARVTEITRLARQFDINLLTVDSEELDAIAQGAAHQGVAAQIRPLVAAAEQQMDAFLDALQDEPFLLLLDGVHDPHNLGACLRSADAAGVNAVILPKDRACPVTPVVYKVASGAAGLVPVFRVTNLARVMDGLKQRGVWLVGASAEGGGSLYTVDLQRSLGLVLGGESRGLRRLTRERCDQLVHIPMRGFVSSLNVSVAVGVCLFEARRQRDAR
jgi:23S rRNA (guanosine2251-2'-O)-methyltransferase